MGENPRAKVSVALIGVGPIWDQHYRTAVQRLSSRLSIRAVCDSVALRASAVADEFEAAPVSCPWLLTQRSDLHAWLILDPGWFGTYPAKLAIEHRRSALLASPFETPTETLLPLLQRSREQDELLVLEFPHRFTPATTRLRELLATRLGRVCRIEVSVPVPAETAAVRHWLEGSTARALELFDWCGCLIGGGTPRAEWTSRRLVLRYPDRNGGATEVDFRFGAEELRCRVLGERGEATLCDPARIVWDAAGDGREEVLCHERSPQEIILDQFCRRALGGLVPVPSVTDAQRALAILRQASEALGERSPSNPF